MDLHSPWLAVGGSAALLTIVAAFWRQARGLLLQLSQRVIATVVIQEHASSAVLHRITDCMPLSRFRLRTYGGFKDFVRPQGRRELIGTETVGEGGWLVWHGRWPVWVARTSNMSNPSGDVTAMVHRPLRLTFLRGTLDPDAFVLAAIEAWNERLSGRDGRRRFCVEHHSGSAGKTQAQHQGVFAGGQAQPQAVASHSAESEEGFGQRLLRWSRDQIGPPLTKRGSALAAISLPEAAQAFLQSVRRWKESREWFQDRSLPWRMGALLHGPPGCLRGDTPIYDPVAGTTVTVADRFLKGEPFHVYALDLRSKQVVVTRADPPHKYPVSEMLEMELSNGDHVVVTPGHQFWDGRRFADACDVASRLAACGDVLLPSISAPALLARRPNAPHWSCTPPGCLAGCLCESCSCGAQPLSGPGNGLASPPSLAGAVPRSHVCCSADALGGGPADTLSASSGRRSTWGYTRRSGSPLASVALHRAPAALPSRGCDCSTPVSLRGPEVALAGRATRPGLFFAGTRSSARSYPTQDAASAAVTRGSARCPSPRQSAFVAGRSHTAQTPAAIVDPYTLPYTYLAGLSVDEFDQVQVLAARPAGREHYYDFHVPVYNNYWAQGVFHHNTGKTSVARAIAEDLDMPAHAFDLASFHNDELRRHWKDMLSNAPCVAVLEDIDNVFHGREPAHEGVKLTYDCLLNCIDGLERSDGVLLIVTTNRPEHLDPALAAGLNGEPSRPGRIDVAVYLGSLSREGRLQMAKRILADWPQLWESTVDASDGATGAQLERRCIDLAMTLYWAEDRSPLVTPPRDNADEPRRALAPCRGDYPALELADART